MMDFIFKKNWCIANTGTMINIDLARPVFFAPRVPLNQRPAVSDSRNIGLSDSKSPGAGLFHG